jgi:beta-barrel assembly-enhancing protease
MTAIRDYFFPINPVTERREFHLIPTSVEKFVGASSYAPLIEKSGGEINKNDARRSYREYHELVQAVGAELARHAKRQDIKFEFTLINSDKDNAWCLPGGKIGINVGLIKKMEIEFIPGSLQHTLKEKIAAVLAHEIVHADARHTGRSLEFRLLLIGIIKIAQLFVVYYWVRSP